MLPATRICPPQVISLAAVTVPVKLGLARGASLDNNVVTAEPEIEPLKTALAPQVIEPLKTAFAPVSYTHLTLPTIYSV